MPKAASSKSHENNPSFEGPRYRPNWFGAVLCFVFGVLLFVAMADYEPRQSLFSEQAAKSVVVDGTMKSVPVRTTTAPNLVGTVGADGSFAIFYLLGGAAWLVPLFLLWMAYTYVRSARHLTGTRLIAMICCIISGTALLDMQSSLFVGREVYTQGPGGIAGKLFYTTLLDGTLGVFGTGFLMGAVYLTGLLFIFTRDITAEFDKILHGFSEWRKQRAALAAARAEERRQQREEAARQKAAAAALAAKTAAAEPTRPGPAAPPLAAPKKIVLPKSEEPLAETPRSNPPIEKPLAPSAAPAPARPARPPASAPATDTRPLAVGAAGKFELNIVKAEETRKAKVTLPQSDDQNYEFPPLKLLKEQVKISAADSEEEHRQNAENLLRILSEFGVEVSLGEIHVGPVITRYEVVPAPGVRVEKISGLDKNIALGMRAQSVRILAPIPGKAAVGVEVPNQKPTPVGMREILESEDWAHAKAELPIALGKDVSGKPLVSDLTKMPHLLIAGATGSGKSVCINSIIASILYSKSPKDVRLIMVDPKVVELKVFNTLPHMLIPVVTEPKKVPAALKWLLGEMEQRYQIFAKANVRNIIGFNNRKREKPSEVPTGEQQPELAGVTPDDIEIPDRLPYIVAIVDELADLMMIAPAEIETSIARLAQLARAAGIHLIIATQRPSVNVITGVIKANLPSRIAFQVASQVDSRTILDGKGAETLIGRGDMLFTPPGTSRIVRAQGAFVADEEVGEIVEFLKKNGPPQYAQSVQQQIDRAAREDDEDAGGEGDSDLGDDEDLFRQAFEVLRSTRRASTSMMQRRLRIGYNRAARIMDLMEDKGIVGPENGSSPREILVDLDTYQP